LPAIDCDDFSLAEQQ